MTSRLAFQVPALVVFSLLLAVVVNGLRSGGVDWGGRDPERFRYRDVNFLGVQEAARIHDQVTTLFLDARPGEEYARRHVFGAVSLPADSLAAAWEGLRDFLEPQMTLVVYGEDVLVAVRVVKFLGERGFRAHVLEGGWRAWRDGRLPVE
jgi:rhodanese-related sulfurtransferase